MVVIPKLNKLDYSKAKAYCLIVLLNCLGKLLEKLIAKQMQFDIQAKNLTNPRQFGSFMMHSNAVNYLIYKVKQA